MIGIYAAVPMYIGIVFLLWVAAACGNAFHGLLTMLDSRERFLDELKRSRATREMVLEVREDRLVALEAREVHFDTAFHRLQALRVMRPRRSLSKDVIEVTVRVDTDVWFGLCGPRNADPMGYEGYVANLFARECERMIKENHWGRLPPSPPTSVAPEFPGEVVPLPWVLPSGDIRRYGIAQPDLILKDRDLLDDEGRVYEIPHSDVIVKPGTKLKRLNRDEENQEEKAGQAGRDESQETHQAPGA